MLHTVLSSLLNVYSQQLHFAICCLKKKKSTRTNYCCQEWVFSSSDSRQVVPADASKDYDPQSLFSLRRVRVQDRGHAAYFYFCKGFSTICMRYMKCGKIVAYCKVDNVLLLTYFFKAIFSHQLILLLALCLRSLSSSPPLYCALELSSVARQSSPETNCKANFIFF